MSSVLIPRKTERGWVIDMPLEMARLTGAAEGSQVLFAPADGTFKAEILPPPVPETCESDQNLTEQNPE